jgi:hypothetical protein
VDTTPGHDPGDDAGDPDDRAATQAGRHDDVPVPAAGAVDGTDHLADPGGTDDDPADDVPPGSDPLRFHQWMKRSATGAVLSGIALGLQQALEPKRNLPAFVMEAPGEPEDPDAPITLHFDPDDPTKTVAVVRAPRPDTPPVPDQAAPDR